MGSSQFTSPDGHKCFVPVNTVGVAAAAAAAEVSNVQLRLGAKLGKGVYGTVYEAEVIELSSVSYSSPRHGLVVKHGRAYSREELNYCRRGVEFLEKVYPELKAKGHVAFQTLPFGIDERGQKYMSYATVMPRFPGYTLKRWLEASNQSMLVKLKILQAVFLELKELHAKGIFHGDLKSDNILVNQEADGSYQVYFIDFDFSYSVEGPVTAEDIAPEKKHYFHPSRQSRAKAKSLKPHPSQDIYSLTCCLDCYTRGFDARFLYDFYHGGKIHTATVDEIVEVIVKEFVVEEIHEAINASEEYASIAKEGVGSVLLWLRDRVAGLRSMSEEDALGVVEAVIDSLPISLVPAADHFGAVGSMQWLESWCSVAPYPDGSEPTAGGDVFRSRAAAVVKHLRAFTSLSAQRQAAAVPARAAAARGGTPRPAGMVALKAGQAGSFPYSPEVVYGHDGVPVFQSGTPEVKPSLDIKEFQCVNW